MGIYVNVYRHMSAGKPVNCTNGGTSAYPEQLCVINVSGPHEPSRHIPAVVLTTNATGAPVIKPFNHKGRHWMMGGNYASTSDSRFAEAVSALHAEYLAARFGADFDLHADSNSSTLFYGAVPIHDRTE